MKNIKHIPMLPFIGNLHLLKKREGLSIDLNIGLLIYFSFILELYKQLMDIAKLFPNEPFHCNWIGKCTM